MCYLNRTYRVLPTHDPDLASAEDGIEGLASFGYEGGACRLTGGQWESLKAWTTETLPRTTPEVGAWIVREWGIEYDGRSGLIALLHRDQRGRAIDAAGEEDKGAFDSWGLMPG